MSKISFLYCRLNNKPIRFFANSAVKIRGSRKNIIVT